jgi:hypothetical protein
MRHRSDFMFVALLGRKTERDRVTLLSRTLSARAAHTSHPNKTAARVR